MQPAEYSTSPADTSWTVIKFGGTSLANTAAIRRCMERLEHFGSRGRRPLVVVSALAGVTDRLLTLASLRGKGAGILIRELIARHESTSRELLRGPAGRRYRRRLSRDAFRLHCLIDEPVRRSDEIVAFGELWSARLLAASLGQNGTPASFVDARRFLRLDSTGDVLGAECRRRLHRVLARRGKVTPVVTGYIAAGAGAVTRTLGRNGSDLSAALIAHWLKARELVICSDVAGVLSADPDLLRTPTVLANLSYEQAERLARVGARILHPRCVEPVRRLGIPLTVIHAHDPHGTGTRIHASGGADIGGVVLHPPEQLAWRQRDNRGRGRRISQRGISFDLPEGNLRLTPPAASPAPFALLAIPVAERLHDELESLSSHLAELLRSAGLDPRVGRCRQVDHCVVLAVPGHQARSALELVHARLFEPRRQISVALVGAGRVGTELLRLIERRRTLLRIREDLDLRVCAVSDSQRMRLDRNGIGAAAWRLADGATATDLTTLSEWLGRLPGPVWVDATASEAVAGRVERLQSMGIAVVTANKLAATLSLRRFADRCRHPVPFLHGTTVGAGMPVLECAEALIRGGEAVHGVRATLSGSVSWILSQLDRGSTLSDAVCKAREKGLTEPDPAQDLSGLDVLRKLVILGRHLGLPVEPGDVVLEGIVPRNWLGLAPERFWRKLRGLDPELATRARRNHARGRRLCLVASIDGTGAARVRVADLNRSDRLLAGYDGDNVIEIRTGNYRTNPLVVQGPGAGVAVTAAGLLADIMWVAESRSVPARAAHEAAPFIARRQRAA